MDLSGPANESYGQKKMPHITAGPQLNMEDTEKKKLFTPASTGCILLTFVFTTLHMLV